MATNEEYKRGIKVPLTVGASIAARTPMCVGQLPVMTLKATGSSGTQIATCLVKGVVDVLVDSACDAVTLTLASVTNTQTVIVNGITCTATTSTTNWSNRNFSIAGADGADAALLGQLMNGGWFLTFASAAAGEQVVVTNPYSGASWTGTAHATTTTAADHEFAINGTDAQDAAAFVTCFNDATHGFAGYTATVDSANRVLIQPNTYYPTIAYPTPTITVPAEHITKTWLAPLTNCRTKISVATTSVAITSAEVISAVTGTAQGATITVAHDATSTRNIYQGDPVYWTTPSTLNCQAESGTFFGKVVENGSIEDRKFTMTSVTNGTTVIINGVVFTAHTNTTTPASRQFKIDGDDTADAVALAGLINNPVYGIRGMTAVAASGTITLTYDGDIVITGTARLANTVVPAPGSRTIKVKLGY